MVLPALPDYHVSRPRLVGRALGSPLVLVEAPSGYGKSAFASELANASGVAIASVVLNEAGMGPPGLVTGLRRSLHAAGLSDASHRMETAGADARQALETLSDYFEEEGLVVILDDVHNANEELVGFLAGLGRAKLAAKVSLILLGRRIPPPLSSLRYTAGAVALSTADLALSESEVMELYHQGFGLEVGRSQTDAMRRVTGGWAAPLILAALRISTGAQGIENLLEAGDDLLDQLVTDMVEALPEELAQILTRAAWLPLVDRRVLLALSDGRTQAGSDPWDLLRGHGVPFVPVHGGWSEVLTPVAERLRADPPAAEVIDRIVATYLANRESSAAIALLATTGSDEQLADLVAGLAVDEIERIDLAELEHVVAILPPSVLASRPRVLLNLARACYVAAAWSRRSDVLAQARLLADGHDPRLMIDIDAEEALDLIREDQRDAASEMFTAALTVCEPGSLARARLLHAQGEYYAMQIDGSGLRAAERIFTEATDLYAHHGAVAWKVHALTGLAGLVHRIQGRYESTLEDLKGALDVLPSGFVRRALVLSYMSETMIDLGRYEQARACDDEAEQLAEAFGDMRIASYTAWNRARAASQQDRAEETLEYVRKVERSRHQWFDHGPGVLFLADAADLLDRVGEVGLAGEYLSRAQLRRHESPESVELAEAVLAARHGDAFEADARLVDVIRSGFLNEHERWRLTLLRGFAAMRRDDPAAASLASEAFEMAARLGHPDLPLVRELKITRQMSSLAATTGMPAARRMATAHAPISIRTLGRFELARGGSPMELPPGQPTALLKFLVTKGGRASTDEILDALWPDESVQKGRPRLRVVMHRLRAAVGEAVVREGEVVLVAPDVDVDASRFADAASLAIEAAPGQSAGSLARVALSYYRGTFLPDDLYADWADDKREQLRRLFLSVAEVLVDAAADRGDIDEALRVLDRAALADPYEEHWLLRGAAFRLGQGRRRAAQQLLERAAAISADLGVPPSQLFEELRRQAAVPADR